MSLSTSKTRKKLIDVSRELFALRGKKNITMNDIAEASKKGRRAWLRRLLPTWRINLRKDGRHRPGRNQKSSPAPEPAAQNRIAPNAKQRLAPFWAVISPAISGL